MPGFPFSMSSVGLTAVFAGIAAGWTQVRNIFQRFVGLVIVTVELRESHEQALSSFLWNETVASFSPFKYYQGRSRFVKDFDRWGAVPYEIWGDKGRIFWFNRKPLWVKQSSGSSSSILRFLRWTFCADTLVAHIYKSSFKRRSQEASPKAFGGSGRFRIVRLEGESGKSRKGQNSRSGRDTESSDSNYPKAEITASCDFGKLVGWNEADLGEVFSSEKALDRLSLTDEVQQAIDEVLRWSESQAWYKDRQIPWRRGLLLYGQPGTGKSSLTKALAQTLDIPIFVFDISTMDNKEFYANWQEALSRTPAIALIEDIDAVFNGRENKVAERGQGLSFDCLLNTISGVESSDGLLLIVTTNNIDQVDPALGVPQPGSLSSRPGRIDRAVELPILTREGRIKMAKRILSGCHPSWVEYLVNIGDKDSGAQFEDRCATIALGLYWSDDPYKPAMEEVV